MNRLYAAMGAFLCTVILGGCGGNNVLSPSPSSSAGPLGGREPVRIAPANEGVLYTFQGKTDGGSPYGGLLAANDGDLYGTTWDGTAKNDYGTVFRLTPSGSKTLLYTFQGGTDAANPQAGVIAGKNGVLFGNTVYGGGSAACTGGCGTVYELTPNGSGYGERVLHAFQGGSDGAGAVGPLLLDGGSLYGATVDGGGSSNCTGPSGFTGCGTVYELSPSASGYTENVVYSFQGENDGSGPRGKLVAYNGAIYGTTYAGGNGTACTGGCGTVFKLKRSGSAYIESIVYNFQGGANDGSGPRSGLVVKHGSLVGVTGRGGGANAGTVFELTHSGSRYSEHVLYSFGANGKTDGAVPTDENGLYVDAAGDLYGTTIAGGNAACACGTIFKLTPAGSGYAESILYSFKGSDGNDPRAAPVADAGGTLYGTTFSGAKKVKGCTSGCGVVYSVSP